jgi:hypothetical protein
MLTHMHGHGMSCQPGFTELVGTGLETVGAGPDRFWFRSVPNRSKFKIRI